MFYSGHPTITHKDYNDQYLVDTRNGRDSVPRKYKKRVKEEESDEEVWEEKPAVQRKQSAKPSGLTITPLPSASKKTKDEDLWKPKGWNQGSDEEEEESPRYCRATKVDAPRMPFKRGVYPGHTLSKIQRKCGKRTT